MSEANGQELPPGWKAAHLGDVLEVIRGVTYRKEESRKNPEEGFVPVLRANNIQGTLVFDDLVYVPAKDVSEIQKLRADDIVVAASSGSRAIVGKAAQLKHSWHGSFGAFCFGLRPEAYIEHRFLGWFLHTKEYRNRVSNASAGVNINNLRAEHIEQTPFRVPPFEEQVRIADALDELLSDLDAGGAGMERVLAKLAQYRAAVLKAAVEGALTADWRKKHRKVEPAAALLTRVLAERRRRWEEDQLRKFKEAGKEPPKNWRGKYREPVAPDTTNLPLLPDGWCWASGEQLFCWSSGEGLSVRQATEGAYPVYGGNGVNGQHHEFVCGFPTLVIGRVGEHCGNAYTTSGPAWVTDNAIYATFVPESVELSFLQFCFTRARLRSRSAGSGQPFVNQTMLNITVLPLAPRAEQEVIIGEVEDQFSVIEHLEADLAAKLKSAQALRQSILRHAFTGQLVLQDPKDEPAAELLKRIAAEREERARQILAARRVIAKAKSSRKKRVRTVRTSLN